MRSILLVPVLILPILAACRGEPTPVAQLLVEPRTVTLAYPGAAELRLTWEPIAALAGRTDTPLVFAHLLSEGGEVLRTFDHPYPDSWEIGRSRSYPLELWQSALNPPLPAGSYRLSLGLYESGGRRWPLDVEGEEVDDREYVIARVGVPAATGPRPEAHFSDAWFAASPAGDQQTLTARWLGEDGTIELRGLERRVRLALTVGIHRRPESEYRLVLDEGEEDPAVVLRSDCSPATARPRGFGSHQIELLLAPAAGSTRCVVEFDPNYVHLEVATFRQSSIVLERLVWTEETD